MNHAVHTVDGERRRCDIKTAVFTIFTAMTCNLHTVISQQPQVGRFHYSFNALWISTTFSVECFRSTKARGYQGAMDCLLDMSQCHTTLMSVHYSPTEFNPHPAIYVYVIHFSVILSTAPVFEGARFLPVFTPKFCIRFSARPHMQMSHLSHSTCC